MNDNKIDTKQEHAGFEIPPTPKPTMVGRVLADYPLADRTEPKRALVVLSGGQDSTTCLALAAHLGFEIHAVTFDYGQRHHREIVAAKTIANLFGVASHEVITLPEGILKSESPLVDKTAELEQYADHASLPGGLEKTFVPLRNQLFFTIAANRAYALDCKVMISGICQEDSGGYPDCRDEFAQAISYSIFAGSFCEHPRLERKEFFFWTPLMNMSKADSVRLAARVPGAYAALQFTHTGYDGAYPPVGKDHATLLRAKGFEEAGMPDPLVMRAYDEGLMELPETPNYGAPAVAEAIKLILDQMQALDGAN